MAIGIVDAMTLEISRILESLFDGIEYRQARNAAAKLEKEKMKARRRSCESRVDDGKFQNGYELTQRLWG